MFLSRRALSESASTSGRYAIAAFNAAKEAKTLDQVYSDLGTLRTLLTTDDKFKFLVESPGIQQRERQAAFADICAKLKADKITGNFLNLLIENKRLNELKKIVDAFEAAYRVEKGQVVCVVASAAELSETDKKRVEKALKQRAKDKSIILQFETNAALLGGLLVKMGDAVFDYSISTKIDRLETQLKSPVDI
jgi:ATP synthase F1 delta subunit